MDFKSRAVTVPSIYPLWVFEISVAGGNSGEIQLGQLNRN